MNRRRQLVLDTETTGLDVDNGDRIIEIVKLAFAICDLKTHMW